ncbi:ABC transporter ATP-binding protein [Carboxylicivirga marina]|uniref:ABC transporter ATP-binding protein n=1 Tax=Carboxylicivirga marina TaxID=2800988 RepID=UPI002597FEF1|nr:ABC transporter ATP-binding protein [uncultured Carboxylicivirga sp.]
MSNTVIKIENLSKIYRLGEVGTGTLSHDLNRFVRMNILGQDDPYAKVGHVNDRTQKAEKGELVAALQDINLEVKEGEVLGIIGKNGAGKSTLLKLLSRVTSPTTGSIKVKGRLASLLEVGTGFHPEMTGRENIYMNGTIMGMRKWEIDRKLEEIVEFAGVAKYLDTPTKRYSSGMTVRLGFAIAAHLEPEILVVDEVLAVGDAEFQKKAIGKMQDVSQNQGRTVLFVSHNMNSIKNLCQTGLLLQNGEQIFTGNILATLNKYLHSSTSDSLELFNNKTTSLNKGVLREGAGNIRFKAISINQSNKAHVNAIYFDKDFQITLQIESNTNSNNTIVSVVLYNNDNVQITSLRSNEGENNNPIKIEKGVNLISIGVSPLNIPPGNYYLKVAISNNNIVEDFIKDYIYLEGNIEANLLKFDSRNLIVSNHTWHILPKTH